MNGDPVIEGQTAESISTQNIGNVTGIDETTKATLESELNHDNLTGYEANEHIDWTVSQTPNIHADNYTDTTYTASGTLLDLTGTAFSLHEGTLTDGKYCTYVAGVGIVCNSDGAGGAVTLSAELGANLLGLAAQQLTLDTQAPNTVFAGPASGVVNGYPAFRALVASDIPALSYLTTETDPVFTAWDKSTGVSITESQISDFGTYLTNLTGLDTDDLAEGLTNKYFPGFTSLSTDYSFTDNSSNWDTAYGWGNHASGGYVKADGTVNFTNKVSYNNDKVFNSDTELVSKKYVDDTVSSAGGYTDEMAQDAIGAMADTNSLTYVDATPLLSVKHQMSITSDTSGLKLSGDSAAPGNSKVYGTDASGNKGWQNAGSGSMTYPGAGIALSTGSSWSGSITNNSANWDTAYGWGSHASAGYLSSTSTGITADSWTINSDKANVTSSLIFGRTTGGDATISWDGTKLGFYGTTYFNNRITGGFGAITTYGTLDWNHISNSMSGNGYTILLGSATNGPGTGIYYHPFNFEYAGGTTYGSGTVTQFAIPYGYSSGIDSGLYMRGRFDGTWSSWVKILSESMNGNVGIKGNVTLNANKTDVTSTLTFGRTTGGDATISWNGTVLNFNKNIYAAGNVSADSFTARSGQITFPATQVPSTNANTLDDYREGTYTPTVTGAISGSFTLNPLYNTLAYIKIGRKVHIQGGIITSTNNSCSGMIRISLPFVAADLTNTSELAIGSCSFNNHGQNWENYYMNVYISSLPEYFYILATNHLGAATIVGGDGVSSTFRLWLSLDYIAAN